MKLLTRSLVAALALAFGYGGSALADHSCGCGDMLASPSWNACGDCCYDNCCDPCGGAGGIGFFGEAEVLFLRYHRADGVRVGSDAGDQAEFDFDPAMRYTAGLIGPGGLGARIRYFDYDHTAVSADGLGQIGVDLWNIDIEAFEAFALNDVWALEVSGGIRFTNFREQMLEADDLEDRRIGVDAVGGIVGLEARRATGLGVLYARSRFAIIQGDKQLFNSAGGTLTQSVELLDVTSSVLELAIGSELNYQLGNGAVLFGRSGLEWQHYNELSSAFDFVTSESFWDGDSAVGFGGFTFAAGVSY
jgi:hypothetical protein